MLYCETTAGRATRLTSAIAPSVCAEAPGAVVLVDQHAAHERVLFDRTVRRLEQKQPSSQLLLIPHVLDLTPGQVAAFLEHERSKSELKSLMPEDAKEAMGHGIRAKRSKAGAVSIDLMEVADAAM